MQTGAEHLIDINKRLHGLVLPDDFLPQRTFELASRGTAFFRVQNSREPVICTFPQARTSLLWADCVAVTITAPSTDKLKSLGPFGCSSLRTLVRFSFQPLSPDPLSDVKAAVV